LEVALAVDHSFFPRKSVTAL
jgi:hypothetical protein